MTTISSELFELGAACMRAQAQAHSQEGLESIQYGLTRCGAILQLLKHADTAMTDRQIMEALKLPDMNCVRPRVNQLIKAGLIQVDGETKCHVTGITVRTVQISK